MTAIILWWHAAYAFTLIIIGSLKINNIQHRCCKHHKWIFIKISSKDNNNIQQTYQEKNVKHILNPQLPTIFPLICFRSHVIGTRPKQIHKLFIFQTPPRVHPIFFSKFWFRVLKYLWEQRVDKNLFRILILHNFFIYDKLFWIIWKFTYDDRWNVTYR